MNKPSLGVKYDLDAIRLTRGSASASGLDLASAESRWIGPGETVRVRTGVHFAIPEGYEIQVRARSGLSLKSGLRLANGIGTVDQDYTGSCDVLLHNTGSLPFLVNKGDRIAQAVLVPVLIPELIELAALPETQRGDGGFGSTGR